MGAIGGLFGAKGGAGGTGFDIQSGVNQGQIDSSFNQNQASLNQQQNLLQALQGQNGLQNQSNVFGQLQGVASGTGPNPAQAMLNQSTGQNVANQAALMAGQRGAGANVGLMARQAGMQGANTQQQAVGQGATMQAQQSMNALGQMGNMANTQVANQIGATNAMTGAQQAEQANLLNAQANVNSANAGLASGVMTGQREVVGGVLNPGGAVMGGNRAYGGAVGMADGGFAPFDNGITQIQGPQSSFGQFLSGVKTAAPANFGNQESSLKKGSGQSMQQAVKALKDMGNTLQKPSAPMSEGAVPPPSPAVAATPGADTMLPGAEGAGAAGDSAALGAGEAAGAAEAGGGAMAELGTLAALASKGGMVDVVVSPDEKIVPPGKVGKAAGGKVDARTVPGRAKVSGDSYANDTVPMKLPPGSIVVPRTSSGSEKDAAAFVRSVLAKRGRK